MLLLSKDTKKQWSNWSGINKTTPASWLTPQTEEQLVSALCQSKGPVRVVGSSHSFTPLCATDGTLIDVGHLQGLVSHDADLCQATIWAGTQLRHVGQPLWRLGQSLINQGDVDVQTLAGACGTSTHGTGLGLGSFSSFVRGLRLVIVSGEVIEANDNENTDIFKAAATSLGALGVISQITVQNVPSYHLSQHEYVAPLDDILDGFDRLCQQHRHIEFFSFFRANEVIVKTLDLSDAKITPSPLIELPVSSILNVSSWLAHGVPGMSAKMQKLLLICQGETHKVGPAYEVFPSPRSSRFNEMEYELPYANGADCLREIRAVVRKSRLRTLYPVEFRRVAADDVWLSPFQGRDSASISIHQHVCADHRPLFDLIEPIFWRYGGRPHWGKLHSLSAKELAPLYPHWQDFAKVRQRLDPHGRMLNAHLRKVLLA
ncbi:MAG: D-arabinono-1,4-lactone oxidase [Moraxellaceae bacterium]|nr:D-arabinono-1,4-lactone oxidase [Moraxellaceae bacterium]MDZ4386994.1 D-arabinono-1,4-lactone oxidase [Moraxellaceae bacterium]